jgi:hypothetical protein
MSTRSSEFAAAKHSGIFEQMAKYSQSKVELQSGWDTTSCVRAAHTAYFECIVYGAESERHDPLISYHGSAPSSQPGSSSKAAIWAWWLRAGRAADALRATGVPWLMLSKVQPSAQETVSLASCHHKVRCRLVQHGVPIDNR